MPFDKITLRSGSSLILPDHPDKLSLDNVAKKQALEKKDIESFGLFDTATPNFHTYYPEVTAEDLKPKKEDYIFPIFRAISETVVHRRWNPIDFSQEGVLKAGMNKLVGQTVFPNHEAMVGNELGVVTKVSWAQGYETQNGILVPAGINAEFKIDGKAHPNIIRGIVSDPPSIHSNSVTVSFEWEQSHKMDPNEFRSKVGQFGEDGKLIRRIVTNIVAFHETSLVAHGADPFAQLITDGKIVNPEYAAAVAKLSEKVGTQVYFFDYKTDTTTLAETEPPKPVTEDITKNQNQMKELLISLGTFLGIENLTEEAAKAKLAELKTPLSGLAPKLSDADQAKLNGYDQLLTDKTKLEGEVTSLKGQVADATFGKQALAALRDDVTRMYKVLFAGKEDSTMLNSIASSGSEMLLGLQKQYQTEMDEKYPGKCNDCGSVHISRNSSIIEPPKPGAPPAGGKKVALSNAEVEKAFSTTVTNATSIHGEAKKPAE